MNDTPQDREDFRVLMMALAVEKHYSQHVDKALLRIYFSAMQHVPFDVIKRTLTAVSQRCKFFPMVNEWLEIIDEEVAKRPAVVKGLLPPARTEGRRVIYCETCGDTGQILSDRPNKHGKVVVVATPCDCRSRNPALGAGRPPKYSQRPISREETE